MVVVTQNKGLTVAEVTVLRQRMRAAGATFKVAKNRLAVRALEGTAFDGIAPLLKGPTALAWSRDPVAVAKAAVDFAKTNDKLVLLGGALGAQTLDADGVRALAELPSLDALRARLVGMIQTPATRIASVVAAPAAGLARVLGAYARKLAEEAPADAGPGGDGAPGDGAPGDGAPGDGAPGGGEPGVGEPGVGEPAGTAEAA